MAFEQLDAVVDRWGQAGAVGQDVDGADAAAGDGAAAVGPFTMDVAGQEHGAGLVGPVSSGQCWVCSVIHSKRLLACEMLPTTQAASDAARQALRALFSREAAGT